MDFYSAAVIHNLNNHLFTIYLFVFERQRVRDFPSADSLTKCLQQLGLNHAEARSLELYPVSTQGPGLELSLASSQGMKYQEAEIRIRDGS